MTQQLFPGSCVAQSFGSQGLTPDDKWQIPVAASACSVSPPRAVSDRAGRSSPQRLAATDGVGRARRTAQLIAAVRHRRWEQIESLLRSRADPSATGNRGISVLMLASGDGESDTCLSLIRKRANVNARDADGATALFYASRCIQSSAATIVQNLVQAGADLAIRDSAARTALIAAAELGCAAAARSLINCKADIYTVALGPEPSATTMPFEQKVVASFLLGRASNPVEKFMQQIRRQDEEAERLYEEEQVEMMRSVADADVDLREITSVATPSSGLGVLAEVSVSDDGVGIRGLDESETESEASSELYHCSELFLSKIAPLRRAEMRRPRPSPEELLTLRDQSAAVRGLIPEPVGSGATALVAAARAGHVAVCLLLLAHGARPGVPDAKGETALAVAAHAGHAEVCEALVDFEAGRVVRVAASKPKLIAALGGLPYSPVMDSMLGKDFVVRALRSDGAVGISLGAMQNEDADSALVFFPASLLSPSQIIPHGTEVKEAHGVGLQVAHTAAVQAAERNGHQLVSGALRGYAMHHIGLPPIGVSSRRTPVSLRRSPQILQSAVCEPRLRFGVPGGAPLSSLS